jgi:hypothetical protein
MKRETYRLCPVPRCPEILGPGETCKQHGTRWDKWRAADPDRSQGYGSKWRRVRAAALERAGHRCQVPGCDVDVGLQVHHIDGRPPTSPGANAASNLQVLCLRHHRLAEVERRRQQQQ